MCEIEELVMAGTRPDIPDWCLPEYSKLILGTWVRKNQKKFRKSEFQTKSKKKTSNV